MKDFLPIHCFRQPWSRLRLRPHSYAIVALALLGTPLYSQTPIVSSPESKTTANKTAAIKSFRIVQEKDGQAVEILSTNPLAPSIHAYSTPERLVIDLPNARVETLEKRIEVQADQIAAIRADQFQQSPPIARVVVDLLAPRSVAYTWEATGNRLVVHLGKSPGDAGNSPFETPALPTLTPAPRPVVLSVRAAGPLVLAGNDGASGSSVTAGPDTAVLSLSSGGEVRVCPGTTVSVSPSQNRHNVMLSMNTGAMEAHLALDASTDSVMTPDFRILLEGPGEFHYAVSADNQGNTCVRALPGNTAPVMVNELLGDRSYRIKATDQLVFRLGQLDRVDTAVPLECGCPPPRNAILQAALPKQSESPNSSHNGNAAPVEDTSRSENGLPAGTPGAPSNAALAQNELHVQVEAPLVFNATGPPPAPVEDVSALPLDSEPRPALAPAAALPPKPPQRSFLKKLSGFLAALFH